MFSTHNVLYRKFAAVRKLQLVAHPIILTHDAAGEVFCLNKMHNG